MNTEQIESILQVATQAGILKKIKRTGWIRIGVPVAESVSEHTFRTTFLCMLLSRGRVIDKTRLMEMALIHDLGESATSDIRYEEGKKIIASEKAKNEIEEQVLDQIFTKDLDRDYYLNLWKEFRDQSSEEARFLKQIEKLEMVIQAYEYQLQGVNPLLLEEFFENADLYIKDKQIRSIFKYLQKKRKSKGKKSY